MSEWGFLSGYHFGNSVSYLNLFFLPLFFVFQQIRRVFKYYFFKYLLSAVLSSLFWDFSDMSVKLFVIFPQDPKAVFIFLQSMCLVLGGQRQQGSTRQSLCLLVRRRSTASAYIYLMWNKDSHQV